MGMNQQPTYKGLVFYYYPLGRYYETYGLIYMELYM